MKLATFEAPGRSEPISGWVQDDHVVAFGGPDGRTLFITEAETGSVLSALVDGPGLPLYGERDRRAVVQAT